MSAPSVTASRARYTALAAAALVVACASAPVRPAPLVQLDRSAGSPLARQVQRDAPAAYAEFARAVRAAEEASGGPADVLSQRVADAEITLAWAATQARGARARGRARDADARRRDAEVETARMEQQAAALEREIDAHAAAAQALARANGAAQSPTSVPQPERAAAAADVRQQAELVLAAAVLLGADEAARAPVAALIAQAETAARGPDATAALVAAGRAMLAAEELVRQTRAAGARAGSSSTAGASAPTDAAALVSQLSDAGGLEPRRDARGVIATLRGLFTGTTLVPTARGRLDAMARVIQGHGDARVRVESYVGGADRARAERTAQAQAQAVVAALVRAGVPAARLQPAGLYRVPGGARSGDVVEIVLVLPTE